MQYTTIVYERMGPKERWNEDLGWYFNGESQGHGFYPTEDESPQSSYFYLNGEPRPDSEIKADKITKPEEGVTIYEGADSFGKGKNFSSNISLSEKDGNQILVIMEDNASEGKFTPIEVKVTIYGKGTEPIEQTFKSFDDKGEEKTPFIIMAPLKGIDYN